MKSCLVISPHLDDAVLSAGQFLAGRPDVRLVTVFAGTPKAKAVVTTYDQLCGFRTAEEAVTARREEDNAAAALVGAKAVHMSFVDSQYGQPAPVAGIANSLRKLIEREEPELVIGPLGINHPDHELVRQALLDATSEATVPLWLYEDIPSRVTDPEIVTAALDALRADGLAPEIGFVGTGDLATKMAALWCYRSQLHLFPNFHELLVAERFWRITKAVTPEPAEGGDAPAQLG